MKKHSYYLSLAAFVVAALSIAVAATLLIVGIIHDRVNLLQIIFLALIICGGIALALFSWKALQIHQQCYDDPNTVAVKQRKAAQIRLADAQASAKKLSSQMLSVLILMVAACIFLYFYDIALDVDPAPKSNALQNLSYETAEVLQITEEYYQGNQEMEDRPEGYQDLTVEITSGEHTGKQFSGVRNNLSVYYGTVLEVGDSVIIAISDDGETAVIDSNYVYDYNRTTPLLILVLFFLLVTVLVGGKVGAKSLLGLGLTILCVFTILFPLLIGGWPTLPTVLGLCAFVTVVEFVMLGGINKKTTCAILGTVSGVAIAMLFGVLASVFLRLSGYQMKDAAGEIEALGQLRQTQAAGSGIRLNNLLVGGILIATLGAVNDVAMSISSAMNELVTVNPNLTRKELFKSGMNIGRDMVGTMTNTLILAFVGGSFVEILYYSSLDLSFYELMSTTFFPIEIMQAIASSVGVILAVPISVLFGMLFFTRSHKSMQKL